MNSKMRVEFEVETLRSGQPRAYADSEYEYLVKGRISDEANPHWTELQLYQVLAFCRSMLRQCEYESGTPGLTLDARYTLNQEPDGRWRYHVREPFCD